MERAAETSQQTSSETGSWAVVGGGHRSIYARSRWSIADRLEERAGVHIIKNDLLFVVVRVGDHSTQPVDPEAWG